MHMNFILKIIHMYTVFKVGFLNAHVRYSFDSSRLGGDRTPLSMVTQKKKT